MKKKVTKQEIDQMQADVSDRLEKGGLPLSEAVSALRRALGLSQDQFACSVNMATVKVSEIERNAGNPTLSTLRRIASEFGLEIGFVKASSDARNPFDVYADLKKAEQLCE